jgi:hypothetical protein
MPTDTNGVATAQQGTRPQDTGSQNFRSPLPDEIVLRIMKYHYNNHIRGVLLLKYTYSRYNARNRPRNHLSAEEINWSEDEERQRCGLPVTTSISMDRIQEVLRIRLVNKCFARCMLDAFFTSAIVFQHTRSVGWKKDLTWFLPCQIVPKLVQRGTQIQVTYSNYNPQNTANARIYCAGTGMDLALSKKNNKPSINLIDARLVKIDDDQVFFHEGSHLVVRGVQFTGSFEAVPCFTLEWSAELIQTYWIMLWCSHWQSVNLLLGQSYAILLG